jgi:hypothetical protein
MSRHHSLFGAVSVHLKDQHYDREPTLFLKLPECQLSGVRKFFPFGDLKLIKPDIIIRSRLKALKCMSLALLKVIVLSV